MGKHGGVCEIGREYVRMEVRVYRRGEQSGGSSLSDKRAVTDCDINTYHLGERS